ncbi:MAG: DUF4423 domain-containing protein, partial [Fibrobacter sp.]|nr:DUF4423 domain-containing protein [Fibrobacter sp.]
LSIDGFTKVTEVIREARRKIAEIEQLDTAPERVYQINFQVFPLSKQTPREIS